MNNAGLYWIAIELTTLVSTFLVAFEREAESIEAAWKYIIVVSAGISLALLGTILFYWSGTFVLGPTYDMTWDALHEAAPRLNSALVTLSFLLVLIGFGTKVGLAPMHTWLPDAHSEGPAPVSALLSGALLNTAMVGIVRYLAVADAAGITALARGTLLALGGFSLFVAALFIVRQTGVKRLMAYSSVEHMGVIALGFGFGGPLGVAGALYHMLNHSLNKSAMFFGAGSMMRAYGTNRIRSIRSVMLHYPMLGGLWLAGAVAITGAPPFALFLSELMIIRAGLARSEWFLVGLMAVLLIVIFGGFLNHFRMMYFEDGHGERKNMAPISAWCVAPLWLALVPLFVMGVWWPQALWDHFLGIARSLATAAPAVNGAMNGARLRPVAAQALASEAQKLRDAGGRIRFAYAWSPDVDDVELRYLAAAPNQREFEMWTLKAAHNVPSLARIWPTLGWYEREMMDLNGVQFADHPEPYPLVLRHGDLAHINGRDFAEGAPSSGRSHLPTIDATGVQQLPFGPIRADVVESAEFTFFYVGEHIIHYQPSLFFKHRGMEKRFEGCEPDRAVVIAERVSGVGTVAHALAYCEAVERAAGCQAPVRARALRVLLAELERLYNHLHYLGHLCHTTTLKVGEAQGKLLEEKVKQLNARLTRKPLPSLLSSRRAECVGISRRGRGSARRSRPCALNLSPMSNASRHRKAISIASSRRAFSRSASPSTKARPGPSSAPRVSTAIFVATIPTRITGNSRSRRRPSKRETPMRASVSGLPKSKPPSLFASAFCFSSNLARCAPSVFRRRYPKAWAGLRARAARCSTRSMSLPTDGWRESRSSRRHSRIGRSSPTPCTTRT